MSKEKAVKGTQVQGKKKDESRKRDKGKPPCPFLCDLVPVNVPAPSPAQQVLHARKDVFVLKVAKVGAKGDRRCKLELELVTPKSPEKKIPERVDTRETQCDPDPPPPCQCCCSKPKTKRK